MSKTVKRPIVAPAGQVLAFRLARHGLAERAIVGGLHSLAERLVGVQAQVLSAGCLSLAARIEGLTPGELERALYDERSLARTWCMRGTVHLISRHVQPLLATAFGPAPGGLKRWFLRSGGVTEADFEKTYRLILDALDATTPLTR